MRNHDPATRSILSKYKEGDGSMLYEKLTDADRKVRAAAVNTLAEDLSTLRQARPELTARSPFPAQTHCVCKEMNAALDPPDIERSIAHDQGDAIGQRSCRIEV